MDGCALRFMGIDPLYELFTGLQSSTLSQWQRFGQSDSSKKSKPQLQILNWSEPYSIGLSVVQLLLPVKEGTTNYSIQFVQYVLGKNTYKVPRYMNLKKSSYRPN